MQDELRIRAQGNDLILELDVYSEYEDVEVIAERLKRYFKASIIRKLDGPSNRVWFFTIGDSELQIHQVEGYGCFLKATAEDAKKLLREIRNQWFLYS